MNFVAVDVETANSSLASICQIGAAFFIDGKLCETWETLVNPEEYFDLLTKGSMVLPKKRYAILQRGVRRSKYYGR
jgi:DNA polymerase III epsilon subunit-like protein